MEQEQIVDLMVDRGKRVMSEAMDWVRSESGREIWCIVAAFSGGDDSIVATHFTNENYEGVITFNADTMVGLGPTRRHIEDVIERYGWDGRVIRAEAEGPPGESGTESNRLLREHWREGGSAYEEFVLNHGFAGPAMHARMYQRLKERSLNRLRREIAAGRRGGRLIVVSGIRHDESAIRAGYKRSWQDQSRQGVTWVNPFYESTAAEFAMYRDEYGLPRNPVKERCGISGECCCGAFGSADERLQYREIDPEFADYLDALEVRVRERFPWGWGQSSPSWWRDQARGQRMMFEMTESDDPFQPMCVGCNSGRR